MEDDFESRMEAHERLLSMLDYIVQHGTDTLDNADCVIRMACLSWVARPSYVSHKSIGIMAEELRTNSNTIKKYLNKSVEIIGKTKNKYIERILDITLNLQTEGSKRQSSFKTKTRMRVLVRRLNALCWLVKPELINCMTTEELAKRLQCDGSLIRHYAAWYSEALDIRTSQQWKPRRTTK